MGQKSTSTQECPPKGRKLKSIVFSAEHFRKMKKNASNEEEEARQKKAEELEKQKQALKEASEASKAKFNIISLPAEHMMLKKKQAREKADKEDAEKAKENEAINHRERIAKAEALLEKLKPGPRDLCTAALQSEILRARNIQQSVQQEFKKAVREQECLDKVKCQAQAQPFIQEERDRLIERASNTNNYKKELFTTINNNAKERSDKHKEQIKEEKEALKVADDEIKAQIAKERADLETKRATLRQNAVEAMRMTEQRRLREQMEEEVESRMRCVYNVGKRHLDDLRHDQAKKMANEREAIIESNKKQLQSVLVDTEAMENERLRRDITRNELKFTEEEREKVLRDRASKKARIEAFIRDMERMKLAKAQNEELRRFHMAERFKNTDINNAFQEMARKERSRKMCELRTQLDAQTAELRRMQQQEQLPDYDPAKTQNEDKFYFNYAHKLMTDAYKKERPLYPLVKAVEMYKRNNMIDCERKEPKHLVSQVRVDWRQPAKGSSPPPPAQPCIQPSEKKADEIREKCQQIDELVAKVAAEEARAKEKDCAAKCPTDCQPVDRQLGVDPCSKLRYSMNELKHLNQYSAPSLHY